MIKLEWFTKQLIADKISYHRFSKVESVLLYFLHFIIKTFSDIVNFNILK